MNKIYIDLINKKEIKFRQILNNYEKKIKIYNNININNIEKIYTIINYIEII